MGRRTLLCLREEYDLSTDWTRRTTRQSQIFLRQELCRPTRVEMSVSNTSLFDAEKIDWCDQVNAAAFIRRRMSTLGTTSSRNDRRVSRERSSEGDKKTACTEVLMPCTRDKVIGSLERSSGQAATVYCRSR
ncbi:hypothetical protein DOTSEDRAFT_75195 [Dothistroma septosporum NZE10]|uniref:Uncharacterized protein n=1 Tax=Dothistroma septosporum (strain NZE10 / CBS 128990) TaxID=675120 RepID=M2Y2A2_DOTSN|nr:hypothetical protein DOTSEDRAFT_75195 [Dothistroma septosporum NZE10]